MNKYIIIAFIVIMNGVYAVGQCESTVSEDASLISGTTVNHDGDKELLLKHDSQCTFFGDNNLIILADRSVANIVGENNLVYVSAKGSLVTSGSSNTIYYLEGAALSNVGTDN